MRRPMSGITPAAVSFFRRRTAGSAHPRSPTISDDFIIKAWDNFRKRKMTGYVCQLSCPRSS